MFAEKGCSSCHVIKGVSPQTDFGPDLASLGSKNASQLEFGNSKITRTPVAYIEAKITDPVAVNVAARMPQYSLGPGDLDALTTALLSMTGKSATTNLEGLILPADHAQFRPAGAFGQLYRALQMLRLPSV